MSTHKSRIAVITGGGRGIGAATARLLGAQGYAVCINYARDQAAAEATLAAVRAAGGSGIAVQGDASAEADVRRLFETVDRELGTVDALVNNAAIHGPRGRFDALQPADMRQVLEVNVIGPMLCSLEAIRRMSTRHGGRGGAIVNVSSGSANIGAPGMGVLYAASKGGLNSFGIGLSQELVAEGIRVNTVSPGLTATDMPPKARLEADGPKIPIGRAAQPEEIAEAIVWLLSDKASYTAGANLRVGGGRP